MFSSVGWIYSNLRKQLGFGMLELFVVIMIIRDLIKPESFDLENVSFYIAQTLVEEQKMLITSQEE